MAQLRLASRLARRFLRNRVLRGSATALGVAVTGLVSLFVLQSAFTLTGQQVAERDLGRFDHTVPLSLSTPALRRDREASRAAQAAQEAGASEVSVELTSFDLTPSEIDGPRAIYLERDWSPAPYPERFGLIQGEWPAEPGEVAVPARILDDGNSAGLGESIPLLSGLAEVTVVGVIEDRYAKTAGRILAAPGTFSSFDQSLIASRFTALDLRASISWTAGDPADVTQAIERTLPGSTAAGVTSRRFVEAEDRPNFAESYPLGWKIPALALPFLAALVTWGSAVFGLRRTLLTLTSSGVGRGLVTSSITGAVLALLLGAAVCGGVLGALSGLAIRPLLHRFSQAPLSPFPDVLPTVVLIATMIALTIPIGVGWVLAAQRTETAHRAPTPIVKAWGALISGRRVLVVVVGVLGLGSSTLPLGDVAAGMVWIGLLTVGLLLLTPEVLGLALRFVPTSRARGRLVRRHLEGRSARTVMSVLLITVALGGPLAFATVLATMIQTDEADRIPATASGQLRIISEGSASPPRRTIEVIARELGSSAEPPVLVWELESDGRYVGAPSRGSGLVMAVESVDALARLNNRPLSAEQKAILQSGGVLYGGDTAEASLEFIETTAEGRSLPRGELPATGFELDPAWQVSHAGVVLKATATSLGLPLNVSDVVYTSLSASDRERGAAAVEAAGLDPYFLKVYEEPLPVRAPPAFYVALIALSCIVIGVAMFVVRTHVTSLRRVLGSLIAVGVSASWARGVVLIELVVTTAVAGLLATVIAGPITASAMARMPGYEFSLPWDWLLLITGACLSGCAVGGVVASRRLRSIDRFHV